MNKELATMPEQLPPEIMEQLIIGGDLAKMEAGQRVDYYNTLCKSLGLNPLTKPFEYITLNGTLKLYARKDATDQLRSIQNVSVVITDRTITNEIYVVSARAELPNGRTDESTGAVNVQGLKGDNLANALMKAETKAKRRVTLSIVGLGFLDETEIEDKGTGEITPAPMPEIPAATVEAAPQENMTCPIHNTNWFKSGAMRGYAHISGGARD